jgi:pimeloyl-ACP methyl ester carboxylesterase
MQAMARMIAQGLFPEEHQRQLRELASARLAANDRSAYLKSLWAAIRYDGRDRLGELKCPTLVVAGERDRTIAMQAKRELAGGIPGAALEILAGSGHATPLDAAPRFNALLSAHLNSVDR